MEATAPPVGGYPVNVEFEYREPLNRLTTAFRLITIIPIAVVVYVLSPAVVFATGLMIVFREKYPRWWFEYNRAYAAFALRVEAYALLLDDRYPSTDEPQGVRLELPEPEGLNRWLPLVKWLLLIPHYVVLAFVAIGALFAVIFAWFAILFTGRYPRALFDFVSGALRWGLRVAAYGFLLVTDEYPPFRLSA